MTKIEDIDGLLACAKGKISVNHLDDIDSLAHVFVEGVISILDDKNKLFGLSIDEVKKRVADVLAGSEITTQSIRTVMTHYCKSLVDLSATYESDFLTWFSENYDTLYKNWLRTVHYLPKQKTDFTDEWIANNQKKIAGELLFCFSNNTLNGTVEEMHDEILVAFCKTCPKAKRHINMLLKMLESE